MLVLVVDGSRTHNYMVSKMVKDANHDVMVATDGPEALEILAAYPVQMLLIGWMLPSMDGTELVSKIREQFAEPYRYIIMITAKSGQDALIHGLHSGVDDFMEKPVNEAELVARIKIGERIVRLEANLQQHLIKIDRVRQEWEATTNAINQLICLVDYSGIVIHANKTVQEWGLAESNDFVGRYIYDLLKPVYPEFGAWVERLWGNVKSKLQHKQNFEYELEDLTASRYFYMQFQAIEHLHGSNPESNQAFAAINIQDITERKLLELEIQQANKRSEELLLNVLPEPIAHRLKLGEVNIAESFNDVTVMFADLVGFTRLTASTPPIEFIDLLNGIFSTFDYLTEHYRLEKIKTIGDSYLVVAGVPVPHSNHATAIAAMALDMLREVNNINEFAGHNLQIRIGIDSGSVIAGVIGQKKFTYDLWGDTVNVASRMESSGEPGHIQVTEATYNLLKEDFVLEKRGVQDIKGKGEMETFWLVDRKT